MQTKHLCVLIHIWTKGDVGAPLNGFKPSSKIFYWPFQGRTSFVDLLCFFLSCVCYAFVRVCLHAPCGHLLGKGWPLGFRLWCLTVRLSLSHWHPGSGVLLDCIDSWYLHPFPIFALILIKLLSIRAFFSIIAIILTKALKSFFYKFALIIPKVLPKSVWVFFP